MKTEEKIHQFPCACEKQQPLEKKVKVNLRPGPEKKTSSVSFDIFCHWCGTYIKVALDGDFTSDENLRE
jgi:hypothetical protein